MNSPNIPSYFLPSLLLISSIPDRHNDVKDTLVVVATLCFLVPSADSMTYEHGVQRYYLRDGLPLTEDIHPPARIEACIKYSGLRDDDIYLLTYPKSGTGLVSDLIYSLYREKDSLPKGHNLQCIKFDLTRAPIDQSDPLRDVEKSLSPRVLGTHLPWDLAPTPVREGKIKTIHCIRNFKDVASSAHPFLTKTGVISGLTWDRFIHNYMAGNVIYGSWFDWMKRWYPYRNNINMLSLYFEDIIQDMPSAVEKIARFLHVELNSDQVGAVVKANTFQEKKKANSSDIKLRKVQVGSWKADFTVQQNKMADEWIRNERVGLDDIKLIFE